MKKYPLLLKPVLKDYLWGGRRLIDEFGFETINPMDYDDVMTKWQKEDGWKVNQSVVDSIEFHNMFTQYEQSTAEVETTEGE